MCQFSKRNLKRNTQFYSVKTNQSNCQHRWGTVQSHLMILLQAPHTGVLPLSSGACCAACRMELRFCIGVGWTGCWCWVTTVLVLSGRKRSAKLRSVTHGGRTEGAELPASSDAVLEPGPEKPRWFVLEITPLTNTLLWLNSFAKERGTLLCNVHTTSSCLLWQLYVWRFCSWCLCIDTYKNLLAQPLLDAAGGFFYASAGAETHHLVYLLPGPWQVRELAQGCGEKMTN